MRLRPLTAAAAAAAVATLTGTAVVATAAAADTSAGTNLSIREARQQIVAGQSDIVSGQLRARGTGTLANATVQLLERTVNAGSWTAAGNTTTNSRGVAHFQVSPTETTRYELRFAGDDSHLPSHSGVVRTVVGRNVATAIGIDVSPHSIGSGESADIRGRLHLARRTRHPRPVHNQHVTLKQQVANDTWQPVATSTTNDRGVVHFAVSPAQTTLYAIFFDGTDRLGASRSHGVQVWVGQPTNLSITTSAASINPGETVSVQGVLTESGQPAAGQTVELRARPAHREGGFTTVASGTTATDGSVGFTPAPTVDTIYRLLFRHTDSAATAVSPRAGVTVRRATSLSVRAEGATIRGALLGPRNNPLPGRAVTLQSSPAGAGTWTDVNTDTTGDHGGVSFAVDPTAATDYRLIFAATPRFEACQSGTVTVGG
jgi:5-hydroxyisourate hydrolase-like protein (transthyretin family)